MTDVKGLTKIGVHHKLFPQGDTFAYVNEYGMIINVVETLCGFDAYMDIENKYDKRFDMFEVAEDNCKSFIHFNTMDEVADYSNKLIYKCRVYGISSYDHSHIHSVADLCNPTFQDVKPYKTEFATERMICQDIAPFKADCQILIIFHTAYAPSLSYPSDFINSVTSSIVSKLVALSSAQSGMSRFKSSNPLVK